MGMTESLRKHYVNETARMKKTPIFGKSNMTGADKFGKELSFLVRKFNLLQNGSNESMKEYVTGIESTKGIYSNRAYKIKEKTLYMYNLAEEMIGKGPSELNFSTLGIYVKVWKILNDKYFITTMMKAYEGAKDHDKTAMLYRVLYNCLVFFLEMSAIHLVRFEYQIANNIDPLKGIEDMMEYHKGFTKSVTMPTVSLVAFLEHNLQNLPSGITSLMKVEKEEKVKANEVILTTTFGGVTGGFIVGAAIAGLVLTFFLLRSIFYYMATLKIDIANTLEYEAELLTNNIRLLRQQLDNEKNPENRKRLEKIIEKQTQWANKFERITTSILHKETEATYSATEEVDEENKSTSGKGDDDDTDVFL